MVDLRPNVSEAKVVSLKILIKCCLVINSRKNGPMKPKTILNGGESRELKYAAQLRFLKKFLLITKN
jgi:hypothetical protein